MRTFIGVIISLLATTVFAGEFYVLEMDDVVLKSNQGQDTIRLKQELNSQYANLRLRKMDLLSVTMVAKTAAGRGNAQLFVGGVTSAKQTIGGSRPQWQDSGEKSYDRVLFKNPSQDSRGKWQLHTRGNFKVRQIVVEIADKAPAIEELTLNFNHLHKQARPGSDDTIPLRATAQQQLGIDTQKYELISATMAAKTRAGRGQAHLLIGNSESVAQVVGGAPFLFDSNGNYQRTTFENPKSNSNGVWQIKLRGNFKIKQVVLKVRRKQ